MLCLKGTSVPFKLMVSLFMLLLAVAPAAARMHASSSALLQVSARLRSVTL